MRVLDQSLFQGTQMSLLFRVDEVSRLRRLFRWATFIVFLVTAYLAVITLAPA